MDTKGEKSMHISKYWGVALLLAIVTTVIGCSALGGGEKRRGPTAIEIPRGDQLVTIEGKRIVPKLEDHLSYRQVPEEILKEHDRLIGESKKLLDMQVPSPAELCKRSGKVWKEGTCASTLQSNNKSVDPSALPWSMMAKSTTDVVSPSKAASAVHQSSKVGAYDFWTHFGYDSGKLVYKPFFATSKSVAMTEQVVTLGYKCSALIPNTQHVATVEVTAAVKPSILFEDAFHRFVAAYATVGGKHDNKDIVTGADVEGGARTYLGKQQETACATLKERSLKDLLADPSMGLAKNLNGLIAEDSQSPFDIFVQTTKVELPEELLRSLAQKALETPPAPPKPITGRRAPAQGKQPCCTPCVQQCTPSSK